MPQSKVVLYTTTKHFTLEVSHFTADITCRISIIKEVGQLEPYLHLHWSKESVPLNQPDGMPSSTVGHQFSLDLPFSTQHLTSKAKLFLITGSKMSVICPNHWKLLDQFHLYTGETNTFWDMLVRDSVFRWYFRHASYHLPIRSG